MHANDKSRAERLRTDHTNKYYNGNYNEDAGHARAVSFINGIIREAERL